MTVKELIKELQKYPDEAEVVLRDRDYGVIDFELISVFTNKIGQTVLTSMLESAI